MRRLSPYSTPDTLAKLDGRSKEARLLKRTRSELLAQLGRKPSVAQAMLVDRVAWLHVHLSLLDGKMAGAAPAERDARQYLAWANTMAKLLARLGLDQPPPSDEPDPVPRLDALLAKRKAVA